MRSQWTANFESLFRKELNDTIDQDFLDDIDSPGKLRKALLAARYDGAEIYATGVNPLAGNLQLNPRFMCCNPETGKSSMGGTTPHMIIPLDEQDKFSQKHHNWSFIDQKFEAKKQATQAFVKILVCIEIHSCPGLQPTINTGESDRQRTGIENSAPLLLGPLKSSSY